MFNDMVYTVSHVDCRIIWGVTSTFDIIGNTQERYKFPLNSRTAHVLVFTQVILVALIATVPCMSATAAIVCGFVSTIRTDLKYAIFAQVSPSTTWVVAIIGIAIFLNISSHLKICQDHT